MFVCILKVRTSDRTELNWNAILVALHRQCTKPTAGSLVHFISVLFVKCSNLVQLCLLAPYLVKQLKYCVAVQKFASSFYHVPCGCRWQLLVRNMAASTWVQLEDQQQFWHKTASRESRSLSTQSLVSEMNFVFTPSPAAFDWHTSMCAGAVNYCVLKLTV